jgi:hypothetical protein
MGSENTVGEAIHARIRILGMNTERLLQFNRYAAIGDAQGYTPDNNPKFFKEVAEIVNDATGRGTAPKAIEKAMGSDQPDHVFEPIEDLTGQDNERPFQSVEIREIRSCDPER